MAVRALAHFHREAGARVALRANAIIVAAVVFALGSAPDALTTLRAFLLGIAARGHPSGSRAALAAICLVLAATGVPRTTLGLAGWLRSLPIDARDVRRSTVLALCIAQLAVVVFVPLAALASIAAYHASLSVTKLLSAPLMMLAASMTVLPVQRSGARALGAVALVASVRAGWVGLLVASAAVVIADALAGEVVPPRSRRSRGRNVHAGVKPVFTAASGIGGRLWWPLALWLRISWRALGFRALLDGMIAPLIFVGFAHLMVRNNPDISAGTVDRIVRLCGVLALTLSGATLANVLLRARQPWPWARSLPWSSVHRVLADACVFAAPLIVVPIALLPLGVRAAGTVAALIPAVAVFAASALRTGAPRQTGAAGEVMAMMALVGTPVVLWPVLAIGALAVMPIILGWAARRERDARATHWTELQHDASGDPAWLSAR